MSVLIVGPSTAVQAKRAPKAPWSRADLLGAREVQIDGPGIKQLVKVTHRAQIKRLVSKMNYTPRRPCRCRIRYSVAFILKDDRRIELVSFAHGWRFEGDSVKQRTDKGALIKYLGWLVKKHARK